MNGFKLTAKLLIKQVSSLGENMAQMLAGFDPESATQVDHDALKAKLRDVAVKLSEARQKHNTEHAEVLTLKEAIARDERASIVLIDKVEKQEIPESMLVEFANNLEDMKNRLPGEEQDAREAKELVDTLQDIVDTVEKRLADFESHAAQIRRQIDQAKADQERNSLRIQNQEEIKALKSGLGGSNTALSAMAKNAQKLRAQADATGTLADIGQKPIDRMNAVDEARRIADGAAPAATESAIDRLRRVASQKA